MFKNTGSAATKPGGIGSLESILGLLKNLKIRAQDSNSKTKSDLGNDPGLGEVVRQLGDELFRETVLHLHHFCLRGFCQRKKNLTIKISVADPCHFGGG
jgi:hypothetical protein